MLSTLSLIPPALIVTTPFSSTIKVPLPILIVPPTIVLPSIYPAKTAFARSPQSVLSPTVYSPKTASVVLKPSEEYKN